MVPPPLLPLAAASEAQRWRLAATVYGPAAVVLEGTVAQSVLFVTAYVCTGRASTLFFGVAALLVTVIRFGDRARFLRAHAARVHGQQAHPPALPPVPAHPQHEQQVGGRAPSPAHQGGPEETREQGQPQKPGWRRKLAGGGCRQTLAASYSPERWAAHYAAGATTMGFLWGLAACLTVIQGDGPALAMFAIMMAAVWVTSASLRAAASPMTLWGTVFATLGPLLVVLAFARNPLLRLICPIGFIQISALLRTGSSLGQQIADMLRAEQLLAAANAELSRISGTDPLTGLANRRALDEALSRAWSHAAREQTDLAVLILDVDHFKLFNDRYGHPAGDDCLRYIAARLRLCLDRPHDLAGRYGGEEFLVLLPETPETGAQHLAERIRAAIEAGAVPHDASPIGHVSASVGYAAIRPAPGVDPATLVAAADAALYAAKNAGRNRVSRPPAAARVAA